MNRTVLHLLSQRPGRTGSGVTLDSIVRCTDRLGWSQQAIVGTPEDEPRPEVANLPADRIHPLVFGTEALPLGLPGMSDVMPYPSRRFSSLDGEELRLYIDSWSAHVRKVLHVVQPDVVHGHHVWLLSSLLRDLAPEIPIVTHCHGTGFRQLELCPHLADRVRDGCARNDAFCVLHKEHAQRLGAVLGVPDAKIHVVGAGYREDVFHDQGRPEEPGPELVYAGKYSHAKGLPSLLDAIEILRPSHGDIVLHVAGDGSGREAEELRARMDSMHPHVRRHGMLSQVELAALLRRARAFVLPSMYEGLHLVLVEAAACGCEIVCTELPGIVEDLAEPLGAVLTLVPLPPLLSVDVPDPSGLPKLARDLAGAIAAVLGKRRRERRPDLARFRWTEVSERVEAVWRALAPPFPEPGQRQEW